MAPLVRVKNYAFLMSQGRAKVLSSHTRCSWSTGRTPIKWEAAVLGWSVTNAPTSSASNTMAHCILVRFPSPRYPSHSKQYDCTLSPKR